MKNYETLGNLSGYYHGTVGHTAGALLFDLCITKSNRIFITFVAGWIISMMAHPVIEYLEEEGKITEEVRFCDLDRGSYHRNHSGSLFCSQRYRTAGHRIYTGC